MKTRPYLFIGSSSEGLEVAKAIQANLDFTCECHIWSQGLFGLSGGTLETLVKAMPHFDFAILALTPDDLILSRGLEQKSPRDNVLFELGLFIGGLGKDRVYIVVNRSAQLKLPSDLAGITVATFEPPTAGTMQSAVGAACTAIEAEVKKLGPRKEHGIRAWWWTGCDPEQITLCMTVANNSQCDVPWLNVHVFPSNTFQLEPCSEKTERLMAGQYAMYRFRITEPDGRLTKWAEQFLAKKREELSVRIYKTNSIEEPVLIDDGLGGELQDNIAISVRYDLAKRRS